MYTNSEFMIPFICMYLEEEEEEEEEEIRFLLCYACVTK